MFGSIKVFFRNKFIKSQEIAIQKFVQSLKGMDDGEIGSLMLSATVARNYAYNSLGINFLDPIFELEQKPFVVITIGKLIKLNQQEKHYALASGFYVWLHSFRAIAEPELRIYGKQMWKELYRGITHINENPDEHNIESDLIARDCINYSEMPRAFDK